MILNAFAGSPILLVNEVGVEKTLQVITTILLLANFRNYYAKHKKFSGIFGTLHTLFNIAYVSDVQYPA